MPVTAIAKFKTGVQMVAIAVMILTPVAYDFFPGIPSVTYEAAGYVLLWVAAALTAFTGWIYFRNGLGHLRPGPTPEPTGLREI